MCYYNKKLETGYREAAAVEIYYMIEFGVKLDIQA